MTNTSRAARRYARALFSLAREAHSTQEVRREVEGLGDLLDESPELREALLTPLHPARERRAVLAAVCERAQISGLVRTFYAYLIDQRRMVEFPAIQDEFVRLVEEEAGVLTADIVSASPLDERRRDRLRRALSDRTGCEVRLEVHVDSDLVGGVVAKVGNLVFDGSIRCQLQQLREDLVRG